MDFKKFKTIFREVYLETLLMCLMIADFVTFGFLVHTYLSSDLNPLLLFFSVVLLCNTVLVIEIIIYNKNEIKRLRK